MLRLPTKDRSAALHEAAVRRPDTLLLYGSSELTIPNPLRATEFFRKRSNGFQVFPIGRIGTTPLVILENHAALGSTLRNKRVVVSISPTWFYSLSQRTSFYEGNFSPLSAYALAFSDNLSLGVRRSAAERMLYYKRTYRYDPVLRLALEALASRARWGLALYTVVWRSASSRNSCCGCRTTGRWHARSAGTFRCRTTPTKSSRSRLRSKEARRRSWCPICGGPPNGAASSS